MTKSGSQIRVIKNETSSRTRTHLRGRDIGLTVTVWLDPLHDGWNKQAFYYGPMLGVMTIAVTELFFWFETIIFGRDILSEWFDKHVGTWREPPSAAPPNTPGAPPSSGSSGMKVRGETESPESQADHLVNVR